uniref:ATP synthase subunit epsilon, mitochondrial n=1 Tax=Anopheles farauti TaxID=69004 RepID=A0A182QDU6_9DIPT
MVTWRAAGLNYINYSNIAARLLRKALKPELRLQATRREDSHIKLTKWLEGKPSKTITD